MPNSIQSTFSKDSHLGWLESTRIWLKELVTPMEDRWTWTASDGTVYEEVVILNIEKETVAFEHKYGFAAVAISNLAREIQSALSETAQRRELAS